ncbi:MAG TPA: ATP-binding protein [Candidatus Acidoferrales bacterium]|nr:ATP-binding protein [Candidatus Acidoferrales bacterium]
MSTAFVLRPTMLATVAHEIRNPLTALQATSEILDREFDLLENNQKRALIAELRTRVLSLRGLTDNLLSAAAIGEGRLSIAPRPLDVRQAIGDALGLLAPVMSKRGQRVRVRIGRIPLAMADERRIGQVLVNLLSNASKYADAGTKIDVSASAAPGRVRVGIADRGPGVPRALARRLFEPYERAGRTDGDGYGIGLSITRAIIDAHHGRIGVVSRPGGGARFWFEIPATDMATDLDSEQPDENYLRDVG